MKFCPDFATISRKECRVSLFQSNLRKQITEVPKFLKSVKIIHYYSLSFIRVLSSGTVPSLDFAPVSRFVAWAVHFVAPTTRRGGDLLFGLLTYMYSLPTLLFTHTTLYPYSLPLYPRVNETMPERPRCRCPTWWIAASSSLSGPFSSIFEKPSASFECSLLHKVTKNIAAVFPQWYMAPRYAFNNSLKLRERGGFGGWGDKHFCTRWTCSQLVNGRRRRPA